MHQVVLRQVNFNVHQQLLEYNVVAGSSVVVGFAQLRLKASKSNEMPAGFESHVYYEISSTHRKKGYATQTLRLLRQEAARHGLTSIVATTNSDNQASVKVIESNDGEFQSEGVTTTGTPVLKYRLQTR